MAAVHDYKEMHHLVDRLSPAEVRRLWDLVASDPKLSKRTHASRLSDDATELSTPVRQLSTAGLGASGREDLSDRVEELLAERFNRST